MSEVVYFLKMSTSLSRSSSSFAGRHLLPGFAEERLLAGGATMSLSSCR